MLATLKWRISRVLQGVQAAWLFGDLAPMVPPVQMMFDGPRNLRIFKANGDEFMRIYRDVCGLSPKERMLDVGSGIGRKTIPLTRYFNREAVYEGIDITKSGIDWCTAHITRRYSNFRFQHIDVHNPLYNKQGRYRASEYRFPFPDNSFDFVMMGSVFTHMLPDDVRNYIAETRRVLSPDGRCLISYFLLNDETRRLQAEGVEGFSDRLRDIAPLNFRFGNGVYRTAYETNPESAIAYDEGWVRGIYEEIGLVVQRIDYGAWCGRKDHLSYQDLILASKS